MEYDVLADNVTFTLEGPMIDGTKWIAVGFSENQIMVRKNVYCIL